MSKWVNLTPHDITVGSRGAWPGDEYTIPPSGVVARVAQYDVAVLDVDGVPAVYRQYGEVIGLPDPTANKIVYVVSGRVLEALERLGTWRGDVVAPDTGPTAKRGADGQILFVRQVLRPASAADWSSDGELLELVHEGQLTPDEAALVARSRAAKTLMD